MIKCSCAISKLHQALHRHAAIYIEYRLKEQLLSASKLIKVVLMLLLIRDFLCHDILRKNTGWAKVSISISCSYCFS